MPDVTGKSPLRVEARQKVLKGSKKTAHNVKKSSTSVAVEQLSNVDVEKNFDKHYVADMFTDEHVTELLSENTALKNKVELISVTFAVVHDKNVLFVQRSNIWHLITLSLAVAISTSITLWAT